MAEEAVFDVFSAVEFIYTIGVFVVLFLLWMLHRQTRLEQKIDRLMKSRARKKEKR